MADQDRNDEFRVVEFTVTTRPPNPRSEPEQPLDRSRQPIADLIAIGSRFSTRLQLLWTYVTQIGSIARATSVTNAAALLSLLTELAKAEGGEKDEHEPLAIADVVLQLVDRKGNKSTDTMSVPITESRHLRTIDEHGKYNDAAMRILHETAVQQLVNAYEQLMADLVRRHILANTRAASKDRTITYQELLEYGSLEEAQRRVTEVQVTDFLRGNGTVEHLAYLKNELGVDVRTHCPEVDRFRELVLRRHAIVHAGGIATAEYLRRSRDLAGAEPRPAEGHLLELSPKYVSSNWDRTYAMGIVTLHIAAQAESRRIKDKDAESQADTFLNGAAFWAIENRRYLAAELILRYAARLHLSTETCQRMVHLNLAQTLKWQGRDDEVKAELDRHDWTASSSLFRLGAEVLRGGPDIERHMRAAAADGELTAEAVYTWPIFRELRKGETFKDMMKRVFGPDSAEQKNRFAAVFLDFDYERKLHRLATLAKEKPTEKAETTRVPESLEKPDPIVH